jgi:hypothetical protein
VRTVSLKVRIGGNILALRGVSPRTRSLTCTVDTTRVRAVLQPFPSEGSRGIFEADRLTILSPDGRVHADRAIVRDPGGRVPRRLWWDDLDLLYFFGYALWNYAVTPYVFRWPGFEVYEAPPWREPDGSVWRVLRVRYPEAFPTHCREQCFYVDEAGLIRRLDYTADVFSAAAKGVHLCRDYRAFDGCQFATHRVVYRRRGNGRPLTWFSVMEGWIDEVSLA